MIRIDPSSIVVTQGQSIAFRALDQSGQQVTAQWTVVQAGAGTIDAASGTYQSPPSVTAATTATIQAAAGTDTATASINLVPPALSILPDRVSLRGGQSQTLSAVMAGAPNVAVTWVVSPNASGWNAATQTLGAPLKITEKQIYTITARTMNPPGSATATIDLAPPKPSVWLTLALGLYLAGAYAMAFFVIDLWPPPPGNVSELTRLQSERDLLQRNVDAAKTATVKTDTQKAPTTPGTPKGTAAADTQKAGKGTGASEVKKAPAGNLPGDTGKGAESTATADAAQKLKDAESALATKNSQIGELAMAGKTLFHTKYFGEMDRDKDLIWIALLCGALGAFLYGAKSFVSFLGNESFQSSWTGWYLFTPLIGSGLALVFYMVFRGGLLTSASSADVNPYGIAGLSALVGMFTKQATNKLDEVFSTMFRSNKDQELKDKLPSGAQQPK